MTGLDDNAAKSGGKKGILFGLLSAIILGAGGFYAAYSGMIGGSDSDETHAETASEPSDNIGRDIVFIPLDPLVISLGAGANNRYLRFGAQLEVPDIYQEEVSHLVPRILDVLNGYLRAVESADIENPTAMGRLRAQMLHRIQVVTGDGRVRDLFST
jgi:flagellar FliL protein